MEHDFIDIFDKNVNSRIFSCDVCLTYFLSTEIQERKRRFLLQFSIFKVRMLNSSFLIRLKRKGKTCSIIGPLVNLTKHQKSQKSTFSTKIHEMAFIVFSRLFVNATSEAIKDKIILNLPPKIKHCFR